MLGFNYIPKNQTGNIDYIWGKSSTNCGVWETWEKPRGIKMISITAIGGGAGGGGGASNASQTARGGGAGGSSGGFTQVLIPSIFLPDILYVSVGFGGTGGLAGNPASLGSFGIGSFVSIIPFSPIVITTTSVTTTATATSTVNHNFITGDTVVITGATPGQYNGTYTITVTGATTFTYTITSTTPSASLPGTGTIFATKINQLQTVCYAPGGTSAPIGASSTVTSAAPSAPSASIISYMPISGMGVFKSLGGQAGGAGGLFSNGAGGSIAYPTTGILVSGGSGGGGGGSAGGAVNGPTQSQLRFIPTLSAPVAANPGTRGADSTNIPSSISLSFTGGTGGGAGSVNGANGGDGGKGGCGSGGGGGGGGSTGGIGGDGGQGLVVIHSW